MLPGALPTEVKQTQARSLLVVSEAAWQEQVIELAAVLGWAHMHVRPTVGRGQGWTTSTSVTGWVDLVLWHERQCRVIAVELKSERGKVSDAQIEVLRSLSAAGMETFVWRPSQFAEVKAVLSGASLNRS